MLGAAVLIGATAGLLYVVEDNSPASRLVSWLFFAGWLILMAMSVKYLWLFFKGGKDGADGDAG